MITLKELAAQCGVSIATVSNILNGKSNVSESTKQRVLQIVEETGYRPNFMARTLRAHKTNTVGLIIDELGAFSTSSLVEGVLQILEAQGYKAIIETLRLYAKWGNNPDPKIYAATVNEAVNEMLSIKVDGIIYVASHAHDIDYISENIDVPIVIAYAYQTKNKIPAVRIDDFNSAYQMTEYLIKKGHKKIALVTGGVDDVHENERLKGFEKAMLQNNLEINRNLMESGFWSRQEGYAACSKLFQKSSDFTAIFCFNDLMAAGVYDYLYENGKQPGKDYSVAGFDNQIICEYLNPPLTTMEIPLFQIGHTAAEVLVKKINGTEIQENNIQIPCQLIERQSISS